jgi:sugar-specific transcriptional regulator TrmB
MTGCVLVLLLSMSLGFLNSIGLTETEAELYEILLKLGESPISAILAEAKMKRSTAYKALYSLEKKGLLTSKDKNKKIHFQPASPAKLLEIADAQYASLERARSDIQAMLPTLTSSYILSVEKPVIRMYEGVEGIKKANLEVLAEKQEILAYVYVDEAIDKAMEKFWNRYYAIRKREKIYVRSITPNNKAGVEYKKQDQEELRQTRLVPMEKFPINIEKNIVGNKVVFFSRREGTLIATMIENKMIADTERAIFELAWKEAERLNEFLTK